MNQYDQIYIHGYYGYDNCGDEAFKIFFSELLRTENIVFTSPKNPPPPCKDGAFLILGGGNIVGDFFLESIDISWRGSMLAAGVGLSNAEALDRLAALEPRLCIVRNNVELNLFRSKVKNSEYAPDLVLDLNNESLLHAAESYPGLPTLSKYKLKKAVVVLSDRLTSFLSLTSVNNSCLCSSSIASIARVIEYLQFLGKYYELHFVAFTTNIAHRDDAINALVGSSLIGLHSTIAYHTCGDVPAKGYKLISEADLLISSKFHSAIFALLSNTPFINISDATKCTSLLSDLGLNFLSLPLISKVPSLEEFVLATKDAEALNRSQYSGFVDKARFSIANVKKKILGAMARRN
jgi:hypothetical protein